MKVKIMGKYWDLQFVPRLTPRGIVDPPETKGKRIRIRSSLKGEEELEVLIHELIHCADWWKSEEFVEQFAEDAARILTKLGYKREK